MANPIIRIHNAETGETVDREMTKAEFDFYKTEQETFAAEEAAKAEKAAAKQAILDKLGLTAEEVSALLS